MGQVENLVILGSGPAGYTAAIYAARANLKPLLFTGWQYSGLPGGQLMTTSEVENFPGFPDGITGPQLMARLEAQAERWGTECYREDVTWVDLQQRPFVARSPQREIRTHSLIVATGATAKRLNLPSEAQYWSNGISACAICDGAMPMFKGVDLAVVGGGDSAAEEALYLTKYANRVHLLVRRDRLRASQVLQQRVLADPKIEIHWQVQVTDVLGAGDRLTGITLHSTRTGITSQLPARGLFYAIGHTPNTSLFRGQLDLDASGYIITQPNSVATSVEGVFAAGDVQDREYRQAVTAAGTGCMAALLAERWLGANHLTQEFATTPPPATATATPSANRDAASKPPAAEFDLTATRHAGGYALRKLFHESDRLLVVKYIAPDCGPCHILKPLLDAVIEEYGNQIHYVEIDIAADPDIAENAQIVGTPTVQLFRDKELLLELKGVKQKRNYRQAIARYLSVGA